MSAIRQRKTLSVIGRHFTKTLLAALGVALTSVILVGFRDYFSTSVVALLYLLLVVICTTLLGSTGGVAASVLAFLAFNYFFLPPYNTLTVAHTEDLIALFVFLVVAVVISNLMGRAQARLEQIQARERESAHLFELSSNLTGIRDEQQIARVLGQHLLEIFQAERVEITIRSSLPDAGCPEGPCASIQIPEAGTVPESPPQTQVLATSRGQLGEIQLWTRQLELGPNETRLLQTIVSQAALAVERVLLSKAENRTRVLEESDRLKSTILSLVSHDLRTPLSSIQAAATTLADPAMSLDPEAKSELHSLLLEETEHLNQLVGNLLNMSRIEGGALKLQRQWNVLADVIESAVERMQRQVTQHHLEVDVSEDLPLVEIDAVLIEQVLINLMSNSLKHAPAGSLIRIRASAADPDWMRIVLINQGPAIPEDQLEHIFEKFASLPGKNQAGSTGLGLSICKGIVEAHGGRIWAANTSEGLEFSFTLPLSREGSLPVLVDEQPEDEDRKTDE